MMASSTSCSVASVAWNAALSNSPHVAGASLSRSSIAI